MDTKEFSERTILAVDNFLHPKVFSEIAAELEYLKDWAPEIDRYDSQPPAGVTCDLQSTSRTYQALVEELQKMFKAPLVLDRIYVNRFQTGEQPRFHVDGDVLTCLLYADPEEWNIDEFGETQILANGEIRGVLPRPNRMLVFDGRLPHRATSFLSRQRHTIATKLLNVTFSDIIMG
jgi:hypothetical protein